MSNTALIIGESGTGKSTSLAKLDPKETFIVNVLDKPLPFRGYKKNYTRINADATTGNMYASDDYTKIVRIIKVVNDKRPEIKNLIIDDFQYVMANEYMRRCMERGFDKFSEIGNHAWSILNTLKDLREDLNCFVLSHSEPNEHGKMKIKTIGKMIDNNVTMEGMFTIVLQTQIVDGEYSFITQGDANHIAKSPMGMFEARKIPNDLALVKQKINEYYFEEFTDVPNIPVVSKYNSALTQVGAH